MLDLPEFSVTHFDCTFDSEDTRFIQAETLEDWVHDGILKLSIHSTGVHAVTPFLVIVSGSVDIGAAALRITIGKVLECHDERVGSAVIVGFSSRFAEASWSSLNRLRRRLWIRRVSSGFGSVIKPEARRDWVSGARIDIVERCEVVTGGETHRLSGQVPWERSRKELLVPKVHHLALR
jgi:hypothetical protein